MKFNNFLSMMALAGLMIFTSCGDDDSGPAALTLVSLEASGTSLEDGSAVTKDLNGTASATDVPVNATIVAEFSRELDDGTVNSSTISVSDGINNFNFSISVSGETVTLTTTDDLIRGTQYTLTVTSAVAAEDGGMLTEASRVFTTEGRAPAVVPQEDNLVLYLPFNGEIVDELDNNILFDAVSFGEDRFGAQMSAGDFNGTTNYVGVEYNESFNTTSQTISYWIKLPESADYNTHVRTSGYVTFSLGGFEGYGHEWGRFDCCDNTFDFLKYFTSHVNNGTAGDFATRFEENKEEGREPGGTLVFEADNLSWLEDGTGEWIQIVTVYDQGNNNKYFYVNGQLGSQYSYEASEDGQFDLGEMSINAAGISGSETNNNNLYIGAGLPFWAILNDDGSITPDRGGPHAYKGLMDDFRIFNAPLTAEEVSQLYDAERP